MDTRHALLVSALVIILLIAGCQQPTKRIISSDLPTGGVTAPTTPGPTGPTQPGAPDACTDVECGDDKVCRQDVCQCVGGTIPCGDACIRAGQCCTNDDCVGDLVCVGNACTDKAECESLTCDANTLCDESGRCDCLFGMTWCAFQKKCIASSACCTGADCRGADDCILSGEAATICLTEDSEEICRRVIAGTSDNFYLADQYHTIGFIKSLPEEQIGLRVNFQDMIVRKGAEVSLPSGPGLRVRSVLVYGGNCE
ncbi:MAG: hypothetical protein ABIC95_00070 [archaeon]